MKLYNKYLLALGVGAISLASCHRDLLSPVPKTSITDASAFSTPSRVSAQLLSLYGAMKAGNFYGGRYLIYGDIRGEDFINETGNLVTGSDVWALNPTNSATGVINLWSSAYYTINCVNVFLEGMANGGNAVVGDATAKKYIAEAKLVRAVSYFSMLQYYCRPYADGSGSKPGLPLRLTAIKGAGASDMARSTVAQVYDQVLKDLNEAEADLPASYTAASDNVTRAHKNTAIALKSRVYLTMQNYAKVIEEANKIVPASAPFKAATGVPNTLNASYTGIFSTYTTAESIFSMPMTSTTGDNPGTQNQLAYYFSPTSSLGGVGNGEFSLNQSGIIADATWLTTDARRSFVKKTTATNGTIKYWLTKYNVGSPYTDWAPVIRYAEVMLSLAEARARTTNSVDAQAVALLNAVRTRSDPSTVFTTSSFANATELVNAILKERRIEFMGEGIRNTDLLRLLQTIPAKGTAQSKSPSDVGYIWPISANELALNTLCTDN